MQKYHLNNRPDREIVSKNEIEQILKNGKYVIISLCRDNEPYIVTLSYGYDVTTNSLYFHSAKQGLKLDFIRANSTVCATIIQDGGYVENECKHYFTSVVFLGTMELVENVEEKQYGMKILLQQLEKNPQIIESKLEKSKGYFYNKMEVLKLQITEIHGKKGS